MLKHVRQNAPFYLAMLGKSGDPNFAYRITEYIEKRIRQLLLAEPTPPNKDRSPLELALNYMAYAGVGAVVWWLESDLPCSPEELAGWLSQFSHRDLSLSL